MAKGFLNRLDISTNIQRHSCKIVPQIMDTHFAETNLFTDFFKMLIRCSAADDLFRGSLEKSRTSLCSARITQRYLLDRALCENRPRESTTKRCQNVDILPETGV